MTKIIKYFLFSIIVFFSGLSLPYIYKFYRLNYKEEVIKEIKISDFINENNKFFLSSLTNYNDDLSLSIKKNIELSFNKSFNYIDSDKVEFNYYYGKVTKNSIDKRKIIFSADSFQQIYNFTVNINPIGDNKLFFNESYINFDFRPVINEDSNLIFPKNMENNTSTQKWIDTLNEYFANYFVVEQLKSFFSKEFINADGINASSVNLDSKILFITEKTKKFLCDLKPETSLDEFIDLLKLMPIDNLSSFFNLENLSSENFSFYDDLKITSSPLLESLGLKTVLVNKNLDRYQTIKDFECFSKQMFKSALDVIVAFSQPIELKDINVRFKTQQDSPDFLNLDTKLLNYDSNFIWVEINTNDWKYNNLDVRNFNSVTNEENPAGFEIQFNKKDTGVAND